MSTAHMQTSMQADAPVRREEGTPASPSVRARCSRSWGPTGPERRPSSRSSRGIADRTRAWSRSWDLPPDARRRRFRELIGVVSQEGGHVPTMTVAEAVRAYSAAYPHAKDPGHALELVGLADRGDARIGALSGGQRRRLDLALAVAGDPELLFLDEPTTGFDPSARRRAWEPVGRLRALGKTVLLTTHYLEEAPYGEQGGRTRGVPARRAAAGTLPRVHLGLVLRVAGRGAGRGRRLENGGAAAHGVHGEHRRDVDPAHGGTDPRAARGAGAGRPADGPAGPGGGRARAGSGWLARPAVAGGGACGRGRLRQVTLAGELEGARSALGAAGIESSVRQRARSAIP